MDALDEQIAAYQTLLPQIKRDLSVVGYCGGYCGDRISMA